MKKIIIAILVGLTCISLVGCTENKENKKEENKKEDVTKNYKVEDLKKLSTDVHENVEKKPFIDTTEINIDEEGALLSSAGLKDKTNVEFATRTEALIGSQAYSFILVKVKPSADIEAMKQEMIDNIDLAKWICARADKAYVTNYGSILMLVMGDDAISDIDAVYENFKEASNNTLGKKLEKTL